MIIIEKNLHWKMSIVSIVDVTLKTLFILLNELKYWNLENVQLFLKFKTRKIRVNL